MGHSLALTLPYFRCQVKTSEAVPLMDETVGIFKKDFVEFYCVMESLVWILNATVRAPLLPCDFVFTMNLKNYYYYMYLLSKVKPLRDGPQGMCGLIIILRW